MGRRKKVSTGDAERIARGLLAGKPGAAREAAEAIVALARDRDAYEKLDREAATHVESVICLRTRFTGDPPYVGWKGLGLALSEELDELALFRNKAAEAASGGPGGRG